VKYESTDKQDAFHPLEDMRMWLLVLYHRVSSHANLKIRRFVQKETLKREYITQHLREYFFGEFISALNIGLIFKDSVTVTQFSKNAGSVFDFYHRYFLKESQDLSHDLGKLLRGFARNATHPQMILISLRLLSTQFGE